MNIPHNAVVMTGTRPGRRKETAGNDCFKSSCGINETLIALCWLQRSLATVNRLSNHTQLEACVAFVYWTQWQRWNPFWRLDVHWNPSELKPVTSKNKNFQERFTVLLYLENQYLLLYTLPIYADSLREFCHFCFSAAFEWGLCRPSLLSTSYFKWSVLWVKTGFHTHCHSFFFTDPTIFIFSIIFIFMPHIFWECWHWC